MKIEIFEVVQDLLDKSETTPRHLIKFLKLAVKYKTSSPCLVRRYSKKIWAVFHTRYGGVNAVPSFYFDEDKSICKIDGKKYDLLDFMCYFILTTVDTQKEIYKAIKKQLKSGKKSLFQRLTK